MPLCGQADAVCAEPLHVICFGLCAVRHRIGHQWRSRRVPSWQNLLSLQITVCAHVNMNVCVQTQDETDRVLSLLLQIVSGMIHQTPGV